MTQNRARLEIITLTRVENQKAFFDGELLTKQLAGDDLMV
jgi:hypothetical protein